MIRTRLALAQLLANLLWLALPNDHPFLGAVAMMCDGLTTEARGVRALDL